MPLELENFQPASPEEILAWESEQPFLKTIEAVEKQQGPFEFIPWQEKEPLIFQRLQQLVAEAQTNSWWHQKLNSASISGITDWDQWQKIPLTTRDNLVEAFVDSKDGLIIPWDRGELMPVASGATTNGKPIITLYPQLELKAISQRAGRFFADHVFSRQEKKPYLGNILSASNGWASHALLQQIIDQIPGINTTPLGEFKSTDVLKFWLNQGLTGFLGLPDDLFILAKQIRESTNQQWPEVSTIIFGGGFLTAGMLEQIRQVFPNLNQIISHFSSTQALHMGVLIDGQMRVADDLHFLEITDENGQWLPEGQAGKLVVTRLQSPSTILRLEIGDMAAISLPHREDPLQSRLLNLKGREGEDIRITSLSIPIQVLHNNLEQLLQKSNIKPLKIQFEYEQEKILTIKVAVPQPEKNLSDGLNQSQIIDLLLHSANLFDQESFNSESLLPGFAIKLELTEMDNLKRTPAGKIPVLIKQ